MEITQVDVPTTTGMIGVLPQHVPTFGCLAPGVLTVMQKGSAAKFFVRFDQGDAVLDLIAHTLFLALVVTQSTQTRLYPSLPRRPLP